MLRCRLVKRNPKDVLLLVYVWGASSPSDASKSDSETINAGGGPQLFRGSSGSQTYWGSQRLAQEGVSLLWPLSAS